jgi:hypothetical protein
MTFDPFGYDLPPSTARIPRIVPGVDRVSGYRLLAEAIGLPSWLIQGSLYDGYVPEASPSTVMLLRSGGAGWVAVPAEWVRLEIG